MSDIHSACVHSTWTHHVGHAKEFCTVVLYCESVALLDTLYLSIIMTLLILLSLSLFQDNRKVARQDNHAMSSSPFYTHMT